MSDRFVWVDIETTGLNHLHDVILEVGVRITDTRLRTIDEYDVTVWESPMYDKKLKNLLAAAEKGDKGATIVNEMHDASGLWASCISDGQAPGLAEAELVDFLQRHNVPEDKLPMCGSSVHFDRMMLTEQMPALAACWGYRNIDVSTVKELCKTLNPELYAKLDKFGPPKSERHRALDDLTDTINELAWYADNFLWIPEDMTNA